MALFKRTRKIGGTVILSIAIGFVISNLLLKNIIQRARPFQANSEFELWWAGANGHYESGYSFPSGHVTAAMAFAIAVFMATDKKYNWPVLFLPLLMASSRIYLMVHYFSDCVGVVSGIIAYFVLNWMYKSNSKLFVWFRELNLFKPKAKKVKSIPIKEDVPTQQSIQQQIYIPQSEEGEGPTLIRKSTQETEQVENSNKQ